MEKHERENEAIRRGSAALHACLSDLGRRATFPPGIPAQAVEARGLRFNATIGQITHGDGRLLGLPTIESRISLDEEQRNRALLYSPTQGHADLRREWRQWQRRGAGEAASGLPVVTVGLTHGLALIADLFGGEGRVVAIPTPFWGNYGHTFAVRTGARILTAPAYVDGRFNARAVPQALAELPPGEPALAIVNAPSNPGGYSPTVDERRELVEGLLGSADERPLLVICDDAYAGLVFEPGVPTESLFWELNGLHPNLVPVKVDGGTKEFALFGGRVGFLTFPFDPDDEASQALESKVMCLTRATVGSPVSLAQLLLLDALTTRDFEAEIDEVHRALAARYRRLKAALAEVDRDLLVPLPFNSGCFALVEVAPGTQLTSERVRRHLLEHHETGFISIAPRYLRIAFCSVSEESLPELVARLETGVRELAALTVASRVDGPARGPAEPATSGT